MTLMVSAIREGCITPPHHTVAEPERPNLKVIHFDRVGRRAFCVLKAIGLGLGANGPHRASFAERFAITVVAIAHGAFGGVRP